MIMIKLIHACFYKRFGMYIPAIIRTCATITKLEMTQSSQVKRAKRNNGSRKDVL